MKQTPKWAVLTGLILTVAATAFGDAAQDCVLRGISKENTGDLAGAMAEYDDAIKTKPNWVEALACRATVRFRLGDLDGSADDFDAAIKLSPADASLRKNRGMVRRAKGDLNGALADYNEALKLQPDFVDALTARGLAKKANRDLIGALTDFDEAIELNATNAWTWHSRACLRYDEQDFTNALADFRKEIELDPHADYARFRIWLIGARSGGEPAATAELQTYLQGRPAGQPDDWPSKIGQYLTGQLAESEFLAAAKSPDHEKEARQLSEACFYVGSKHLFDSDRRVARDFFLKSIFTGRRAGMEYGSALAEMDFLAARKN